MAGGTVCGLRAVRALSECPMSGRPQQQQLQQQQAQRRQQQPGRGRRRGTSAPHPQQVRLSRPQRLGWSSASALVLLLSITAALLHGVTAADGPGGEWDLRWGAAFNGNTAPILRQAHTAVAYQARSMLVLFGGYGDRSPTDFLQDSWTYNTDAETWTQIATTGTVPAGRAFHTSAVHEKSGSMLMFGGMSRPRATAQLKNYNDIWKLDVAKGQWTELKPASTLPAMRNEPVSCMIGESMFIFGGVATGSGPNDIRVFGDLWQYRMDVNLWKEVTTSSSRPSGRFSHAAALLHLPLPPTAAGGGRRLDAPSLGADAAADTSAAPSQSVRTVHVPDTLARALASPTGRLPEVGRRGNGLGTASGTSSDLPRRQTHDDAQPRGNRPLQLQPHQLLLRGLAHGDPNASGRQLADTSASTRLVVPSFTTYGGRDVRSSGPAAVVVMLEDTWTLQLDGVTNTSDPVRRWVSGTWHEVQVPGFHFSRIYHSAVAAYPGNQLVVFGGFSRLREQNGQTVGYIFNDLLAVTVPEAGTAPAAGWQIASFPGATLPAVRYDHAAASVNGSMLVFGGRFDHLQSGLWSIDVHKVAASNWRAVAADDFQGGSSVSALFSSPHFMIAVLSLMVLCFCVFVVSLRRTSRRRRFEAGLANLHGARHFEMGGAPMQTGVPQHILATLPTRVFHAAGDEGAGAGPGAGAGSGSGAGSGAGDGLGGQEGRASHEGDGDVDELGQTTCSICLCEYEDGDTLTELPCRHRYHPPCITQWLKINKHCPMCKHNVMA